MRFGVWMSCSMTMSALWQYHMLVVLKENNILFVYERFPEHCAQVLYKYFEIINRFKQDVMCVFGMIQRGHCGHFTYHIQTQTHTHPHNIIISYSFKMCLHLIKHN